VKPVPGKDGILRGQDGVEGLTYFRPYMSMGDIQTVTGKDRLGFHSVELFMKNFNPQEPPESTESPADDPGVKPLQGCKRDDTFIARVYAQRNTGEIIYLKWVKWRVKFSLNFTINFDKKTQKTMATHNYSEEPTFEKIGEGVGKGPVEPATSSFFPQLPTWTPIP
jgi:hypothetical protein